MTEPLGGDDRLDVVLGRSAGRAEFAALILGLLLGAIVFALLFGGRDVDFEELALGGTTVPDRPIVDGFPIHCEGFPLAEDLASGKKIENIDGCIEGDRARGLESTVLWVGNSQIHAINQYEPGDQTAVPELFDALSERDVSFITVSYPNGSQQEHLVVYSYVKPRVPLKAIILSLVFDDFRESGIRDRLSEALHDEQARATLTKSELGRGFLAEVERDESSTGADLLTLQDRSESKLEQWLSARSTLWAKRPQARGGIFEALYKTRNAAFGIDPQSIRKMIPGAYNANLSALEAILVDAQDSGVQVLGYIAPLRDDVPPPYAPNEYKKFISDMESLFATHGAVLRNMEKLVPAQHWGAKDSTGLGDGVELDFMHFQGEGHALLASELVDLVQSEVLQ